MWGAGLLLPRFSLNQRRLLRPDAPKLLAIRVLELRMSTGDLASARRMLMGTELAASLPALRLAHDRTSRTNRASVAQYARLNALIEHPLILGSTSIPRL